jgi:site-specific recombinase XerD
MKQKKQQGLIPAQQANQLITTRPLEEVLSGIHSERTKKAYSKDVRDFFGTNDLTLEQVAQIKPSDVARFRDQLIKDGRKPSTINRKMCSVRYVFDKLLLMNMIPFNPAHSKLVKAPKQSTVRHTDYLSWEEIGQLVQIPDQTIARGRRDHAMLMLAVNLGLRKDELLSIKLVDLKTGPTGEPYVWVRGKGEKERFVGYAKRPEVEKALDTHLKDRGQEPGYLFHGRKGPAFKMSDGRFWQIVTQHAEAAGLLKKGIHPHTLRAAFITMAHDQGVPVADIQRAVGHSRGETTLGYVRDLEMIKNKAVSALKGLGTKNESGDRRNG